MSAEKKPTPPATEVEKPAPKVVPLSGTADASMGVSKKRPKNKRRNRLLWSFILFVLAPIALGIAYYTEYATDRYVATSGFAIRGVSSGGGIDSIGALTGLASSGSTTSDSYIVMQYLKSRDLVEKLSTQIDMRAAFSAEGIDPISRMDPEVSVEEFVKYWESMIATSFDATSGIVTFEVQAYNPQDAKKIGDLVLEYTDDLVNELSERARADSVSFAEGEVSRAEERLLSALQAIRVFRAEEQSINPAATAQIDIELLGQLEARLIDLRARIASISGQLDENAPSLISLRRQAAALEAQIAERTNVISTQTPTEGVANTSLSDLLVEYETLEVEKTFAQQAYQSSLSSLEQARVEAGRQQRYLAVFTNPMVAQEPAYPDRPLSILMLIIIVFSFWGIITLIVYSVRDHLS